MASYLSTPFGSATAEKYSTGGVEKIFIAPKSKVKGVTATTDATGTKNIITAFTLETGVKFQEIVFIEDTASLQQAFKLGSTRKSVPQTLGFSVAASGADAIEAMNQLTLTRSHVAIVQVRDGQTYVAGVDFGLKATDVGSNSGAKADDDSALTFVLSGNQLGYAPELQLASPADLDDYVTYAA